MKAVDTHVHLDFPDYQADRQGLIESLRQADIGVITIATSTESNQEVNQLSRQPLIWGAVGLHPTEISTSTLVQLPNLLTELELMIQSNSKIVAIGEVGLDYYHEQGSADIQKTALRQLLTLAQELKKPIIFHCREAYGDLITILGDYPGLRGVVHCFSGSREQAEKFLELGLYLSFTANITYPKNQELLAITKQVPLEKLLIETDSPFLAPQAMRGQRNDPHQVLAVAQAVSEARSVPQAEVLARTTANAQMLFGLG